MKRNNNENYNLAKNISNLRYFYFPNDSYGGIIESTSIIWVITGDKMCEVIYNSDTYDEDSYASFVSEIDRQANGNIFCIYKKNDDRLRMICKTFDDVCQYISKAEREGRIEAKVCDDNLVINDDYEVKKTIPMGTAILKAWYQGVHSHNETFGAFVRDGLLVTKLFAEGVKE